MRIRQVKPSFWTDPTIASVSYQARLFYIGLWCAADDAGYIDWRPAELGALLFPYESAKARLKHMEAWTAELVASGRLKLLADCPCAVIPTLPQHQRIAGRQAFTNRDRHERHRGLRVATGSPISVEPLVATDSTGKERNVEVGNGRARDAIASEFTTKVPRPVAAAKH